MTSAMNRAHFSLALILASGLWATMSMAGDVPMRAPPDWVPGAEIEAVVVQVIDGDTLRVRGATGIADVRLHGIDAPEYNQNCLDATGAAFACGATSTQVMMNLLQATARPCPSAHMHGACLISALPIVCQVTDINRHWGRPVARCYANGVDIQKEMVRLGYARASYARDYLLDMAKARLSKQGLWAGQFTDPADVRHGTDER